MQTYIVWRGQGRQQGSSPRRTHCQLQRPYWGVHSPCRCVHCNECQGWGLGCAHAGAPLERLATGVHGDAGQGQKTGPDLGPQAAAGALAVSVLSHGCTPSPQACPLQWKPEVGVGLGTNGCSAGGANSKCVSSSGC